MVPIQLYSSALDEQRCEEYFYLSDICEHSFHISLLLLLLVKHHLEVAEPGVGPTSSLARDLHIGSLTSVKTFRYSL